MINAHNAEDTRNYATNREPDVEHKHEEETLGVQVAFCTIFLIQVVSRANLARVDEAEDDANYNSNSNNLEGDCTETTRNEAGSLQVNAVEDTHGQNDEVTIIGNGKNNAHTFSDIDIIRRRLVF